MREVKRLNAIIYGELPLTKWVSEENMTKKEKEEYPNYKTMGGYLRTNTYKQAWQEAWKHYTKTEKKAIQNLPNFNKNIFYDITGIEVEQ